MLTFSCADSDDSVNQNETDVNFYALTLGNSWVYKNYRYDQNTDDYYDTGVIDSVSIVSTEDIWGISYFKFRRLTSGNESGITYCNQNGEYFEFLREFEGSLINEAGIVKFTNNNYVERLLFESENYGVYETLIDGDTALDVEAGQFLCVNSERYLKTTDGQVANGIDRFYYASGYGLVYDTSSFASKSTPSIIRRLDSYEVQ